MQITTAIPVAGVGAGVTTEVEDEYGAWLVANGYATKGKAQRTGAGQDQGQGTTPTPSGTPTTQAPTTPAPTSGQGKGTSSKKSSTKNAAN